MSNGRYTLEGTQVACELLETMESSLCNCECECECDDDDDDVTDDETEEDDDNDEADDELSEEDKTRKTVKDIKNLMNELEKSFYGLIQDTR
jgi:hypothetical protein